MNRTSDSHFRSLFLLMLLVTLAGCGGETGPNPPRTGVPAAGSPGGGPPPEVEVIQVSRGEAQLTPELSGRVEAVRTAQVRARVEGIVERRLFAEGSEVRAGQPLFRLDDRPYRAAAQAAEADVEVKRIQLARLESLLPMKAVSQQEVDLARAQLKQAEAQLARAQLDLENTTVPAPIAGRIGRAQVTEGALVGRGEANLMAVIEQLDPIYVLFTQPNAQVLRLQAAIAAGQVRPSERPTVELILEDGSIYTHKGRLITRDASVDPTTGAITLKAEFPNPHRQLLPGTFVRVRMPQGVVHDVVRVPQRAVLSGPQGQYVLLVGEGNTVRPQPVKVGSMAGADFLIEEGLTGGETVIVKGLQKARPGMVVAVTGPRTEDR